MQSDHCWPKFSWLLQHCLGICTKSDNRRVSTCVKCCCLFGDRSHWVWSWLVTASPLGTTLSWLFWMSRVQAWCHDGRLCSWSSTSISVQVLPVYDVASQQHLWSASRRLIVLLWYRLNTFGQRHFFVACPVVRCYLTFYITRTLTETALNIFL